MSDNQKAAVACFYRASTTFIDKTNQVNVRAVRDVQYGNQEPEIIYLGVDTSMGREPLTVNFYCLTTDPSGELIQEYRWDTDGDGNIDQVTDTNKLKRIFKNSGTFNATCAIRYNKTETATSRPVVINVVAEDAPQGTDPTYVPGPYNYYVPGFTNNNNNWTGLALSNERHSYPADAYVTVYDNGGSILGQIRKNVPSWGRTSFPIITNYQTSGWLKINSNHPLAGLAFVGDGNYELMADVPFTENLANKLVIPHVANDDIWETDIWVCNPQSQLATVNFVNVTPSGSVYKTKTLNVPAMGAGSISLSNLLGKPISGKLYLEANQMIAAFAIYSNTAKRGSYFAGINATPVNY